MAHCSLCEEFDEEFDVRDGDRLLRCYGCKESFCDRCEELKECLYCAQMGEDRLYCSNCIYVIEKPEWACCGRGGGTVSLCWECKHREDGVGHGAG